MAENIEDEFGSIPDGSTDTPAGGGGGLRKQLEDALRAFNELKAETEELRKFKSQQTVGSIFKELGLPEKIAKLYTGEPDKDKAREWATEYADVFGFEVAPPSEEETADAAAEIAKQYQAVHNAQNGTARPDAASSAAALMSRNQRVTQKEADQALDSLLAASGLKTR